ncbi:tight adherence protein B [Arthrobacter sp. PvP102]|uniref:type II secretion system F family protein n=1 Tax=unclassified Arthrobacter TaxID=235627 RepID=UPI0000527800|nr:MULTISPECIES: type II secretion system F family protein [unclassified Arthrobacter]ABK04313.1 type II secretion system protein [Arthrobacter sp. FB24]MBP1232249.1 tight adherence protein B [Arthrobacter sp. PvP103]MBP1237384.1 tight adherence protein B [Arthrobacter sp. PvP102]
MLITVGAALLFLAPLLLGVALLIPGAPEIALSRRRPYDSDPPSRLTRLANITVGTLDRFLAARNLRLYNRETLETAGVRLSQAEFIVLVMAGAIVGALVGLVIGVPVVSILLVILAPFVGHLVLGFLAGKRRARFDQQLGDTLQLLAGGLRAGHSILRAIDAAAAESQSPTSEEMRRVITETSLGRDLLASLTDTSERMKNEDFVWIAQAIQINREVGGNLAEVLDQVNETIRERSEIKGHIKALAAEGKFSAYILIAMPIGIVLMLMAVNPGYMDAMFTHPLGWAMIAASVVFMTIGSLWMRKIIDLKF